MLVLTRRPSESIIIDRNIVVKIVGVEGSKVRIGIDAPPDVSIHREEIQHRIERLEAAEAALGDQGGE